MSKNVVFCADGTWSGPDQPDNDDTSNPTNVLKLFENLDGADTHETASQSGKERERSLEAADGTIRQIAKYLHGVGDSDNFLVKVLGGALGAGLITRIVRGYTFLSRSWATGDRIFIIGFSRGAYTARAVADLVAAKGLLDATKLDLTDKTRAYRLGAAVWYLYQRDRLLGNKSLLGELEDAVLDLPGFLTHPPSTDQLVAAPIDAVAVWDTVGALGIPQFNVKGMRVDSLQFIDLKLSAKVSRGLHAVAIDERRADFTPTLWDADPRITQMLFAGAHGDVGGSYLETNDESGLSDGALAWMTGELAQLGVDFSVPPARAVHPDVRGMAHRPWLHPPWTVLRQDTRQFPNHGLEVSTTVQDRMAAGDVPVEGESPRLYRPPNLPGLIA
jgi:uncharacterized protein (DUF2235 family)